MKVSGNVGVASLSNVQTVCMAGIIMRCPTLLVLVDRKTFTSEDHAGTSFSAAASCSWLLARTRNKVRAIHFISTLGFGIKA